MTTKGSIHKPVLQFLPPEKLIPYSNNAVIHSDEAIDDLAGQISEFGFDQPIVVDKDLVIAKGHRRREAAIRLALKEVPVIVATHLNEEQIKAMRIADNKVADTREWDYNKLRFDLNSLQLKSFNMKLTGFKKFELKSLVEIDPGMGSTFPSGPSLTVPSPSGGGEPRDPSEVRMVERNEGEAPKPNDPNEEWKGMPEFDNEDQQAFRTIKVHFETQEAVDEFAKIINQNITEKTKFLWHPKAERKELMGKNYVSESDES